MTTMPEVTKPPPRTAASPASASGGASHDEPGCSDFASLLDGDGSGTAESDSAKGRGKAPRPDSAAIATTAETGDMAEPVIAWLAAPLQPAPLPNTGGLPAATAAAAPAGEATAPTGTLDGLAAGGQAADPAALPIEADGIAPLTATAAGATARAAAPAGAQPPLPSAAEAPPPPPAPPPAPLRAEVAPTVPLEQPPPPEAPALPVEPRRAAKNAGRAANAAANLQGQDGGKPDPAAQVSVAMAARTGQPAPSQNATPQFLAPMTAGSSGNATPDGLNALPTLPGQAASHYAAAASSGRVAGAAHSPAMAQLTAPLIRVAEAGGGAFHIDLTPVELGRISVVADINDGNVTLSVQAEHADTLALLRRDLQLLEKALGDAGLKLDNANLQFSLHGDGQSRGSATPDQGSGGPQGNGRAPAAIAALEPTPAHAPRPIDGLVDVTI